MILWISFGVNELHSLVCNLFVYGIKEDSDSALNVDDCVKSVLFHVILLAVLPGS